MNKPAKKPGQQPESYQPQKEIPAMKNALDFNIPFCTLSDTNFINCFAATYVFLENINVSGRRDYKCPNGNKVCVGCGGECNDSPASKQTRYFCLFDTMCGHSSTRCRYDGASEMQNLVGANGIDDCGSDYTVDFLFGFAGYEYLKCTDTAKFKDEIVASIGAGKPVIAKVKSDVSGLFRVITGHSGGKLICPDYKNAGNPPKRAPKDEELEVLYIIGDKATPRYTLKDGLERIRQVMEANLDEKLWDGYIEKLFEHIIDPPGKLNRDAAKACMKRLADTAVYTYNGHNFGETFRYPSHEELRNPALAESWEKISVPCCRIVALGHTVGFIYAKIDWPKIHPTTLSGIGDVLAATVRMYKEIDAELLEIIEEALAIYALF